MKSRLFPFLLIFVLVLTSCAPNVARLEKKGDVEHLIEALGYEKDAGVRAAAAAALANLDDTTAVDALTIALEDPEAEVRAAAVSALAKLQGAAAAKTIVTMLKDEDEMVRNASQAELLGLGQPAVKALIAALNTTNTTFRESLQNTLSGFGETAAGPLVKALSDKNKKIRESSQEVLVQMGADAAPSVVNALADVDADLRLTLVDILTTQGAEALPALLAALGSNDAGTAQTASELLVLLPEKAIDPLIALLNDENLQIRQLASETLVQIGEAAVEPLIQILIDTTRQQAAAEALISIGEPAVDALIKALQDENRRDIASETLTSMGVKAIAPLAKAVESNPEIIPYAAKPLVHALFLQDKNTRKKAVESVIHIGELAVPLILEGLRNQNQIQLEDTVLYAVQVYYIQSGRASGTLANGGLCNQTDTTWKDKIVLCQRGEGYFYQKVLNVETSGGVGVILYNNVSEDVIMTLGEDNGTKVPVVSTSLQNGQDLATQHQGEPVTIIAGEFYPEISQSLVEIGPPALPYLVDALADPLIYDSVQNILTEMGSAAADSLISAAEEREELVSMRAISVLGNIGGSEVETSLIKMLANGSKLIQREAAAALGSMKSIEAIEPLTQMLYEQEGNVRDIALTALQTIGMPAAHNLLLVYLDAAAPDPAPIADLLRTLFNENKKPIINAAKAICEGEALANTVKFDRYQTGPHPLVIMTTTGVEHSWNYNVPVEWLPYSPEDIQTVVCLGEDETVFLQRCSYYYVNSGLAAPSISRYRYQTEVSLNAAITGYQIAATTLRGSAPGGCPAQTSNFSDMYGGWVEYKDLTAWLMARGIDLEN